VGNRVLEIVLLLMSHIKEHQGRLENFEDITSYLESNGYTENEISSAYSWVVEQLQTDSPVIIGLNYKASSLRALTDFDRRHFTMEALGYLFQLKHLGLISDSQMELILDRGAFVGPTPVDLDQAKVVVESVILHEPGFSEADRHLIFPAPEEEGRAN
jgi:uncharacterized protein Smg (DUF494 family)